MKRRVRELMAIETQLIEPRLRVRESCPGRFAVTLDAG